MKTWKFLAVVLLAALPVSGQWLETTIPLDSPPGDLCYNPTNRMLYVAHPGRYDRRDSLVSVVNGTTNEVEAVVRVDEWPVSMVCNPVENEVYVRCSDGWVYVIDGETHRVTAILSTIGTLDPMAYSPGSNKLYCANWNDSTLAVFDAGPDTLIRNLRLGYEEPWVLCVAPDLNKLYCAAEEPGENVLAINCATDSIVAVIPDRADIVDMVYAPDVRKVFASAHCSGVHVIDAVADTFITLMPSLEEETWFVCYNSFSQKLYAGTVGWLVLVFDAVTNTLIDTIPGVSEPAELVYNGVNNKVYCASPGEYQVVVIDGETDEVVRVFDIGDKVEHLAWNPDQNRVYAGVQARGEPHLVVFRDSVAPAVAEEPPRFLRRPGGSVLRASELVGFEGRILDVQGREVRLSSSDLGVCTSPLPPGVYFLKSEVRSPNAELQTRKVVITR